MAHVSILVVTPTKGFGQLIKQTLEDSSRYIVTLVESLKEALEHINNASFDLAIIDSGGKEALLVNLAQSLRTAKSDLKLIIIPPDNDLKNPIISAIAPDGYLTKPFYLPDLFDTIEEVLGPYQPPLEPYIRSFDDSPTTEPITHPPEIKHSIEWMDDSNVAGQYLKWLLEKFSALYALIVRDDQPWAYAGQLTEKTAHELTSIINNFWITNGAEIGVSGDKIQFIRLDPYAMGHILYAMTLRDGLILALIFDPDTPFSKVRAQAVDFAQALFPGINQTADISIAGTPIQGVVDGYIKTSLPSNDNPDSSGEGTESETRIHNRTSAMGTDKLTGRINKQDKHQDYNVQVNSLDEINRKSKNQSSKSIHSQGSVGILQIDGLRPISPTMHNLSFACLLIPRIPDHYLIGELASSIAQWLSQLCLAYGWRLEHQSIRPGYLLWIALVSPSTSPSFHIRIIRKQTSQQLFTSYPQYKKANPSGDFWAPGYLIVSSNQPPSASIIKQYIDLTRHHQGI